MAQNSQSRSVSIQSKTPLFGAAPKPAIKKERDLTAELNNRLKEKYRGYERAAARLELRGEHDAATVLRKAASRVRLLRKARHDPANDSASSTLFADTKT
ncbi:MAG: hypothetical protein AAFW68_10695 [Pseudomonadota bacterium]